ncbi:MAG: class I SAM-dependent methyltransferase [Mycobacteriales bacterium]
MSDRNELQLSGAQLYGDDLSADEIRLWYEEEETGFLDLLTGHYAIADEGGNYEYEYEALNRFHAIDGLSGRRFDCCVALGCANGADVAPLAGVVDRFVAIEPAQAFWRDEIGGKPARYLRPSVMGDIALPDRSADLATSFGVLHHIPHVSHSVEEMARVLAPGGLFLVREPVSWMGDWRRPRPGLTKNERGLPMNWFETTVTDRGFDILGRRVCMFNPLSILAKRLGLPRPYTSRAFVVADWLVSEMLRWTMRYRRANPVRKLAPSSAFWILRRR